MNAIREVRVPCEGVCPRCTAGPHPVELAVGLTPGTLLFGGPGTSSAGAVATATLTCPITGLPFEVTVNVPAKAGERIDFVRVLGSDGGNATQPTAQLLEATPAGPEPVRMSMPAGAVASETEEDWRVGDLTEWRKGSAEQARDAAGKLLAAGAAAVGAYFAILKVVAGGSIHGSHRVIAIVPAIGYLVVCVLAAIALRPVLVRVWSPSDFEQFREQRLKQLNLLISAAVLVFVLATVLAVVAYAVTLP